MMEQLLHKNNPRFVATYICKVGEIELPRGVRTFKLQDMKCYIPVYNSSTDYKAGQEVYIAKPVKTGRHETTKKWTIHKIKLAEYYNWYLWWHHNNHSAKAKRMFPYVPTADVHFDSRAFILEVRK